MVGRPVTDDMWTHMEADLDDVPSDHWAYKYFVMALNGFTVFPVA
jgi:hypothetical protein